MDIHKPKPWHSVREFLKEYVIIVVGVLTALGAEQVAETLHWRHLAERHEQELHASAQLVAANAIQRLAADNCLHPELQRVADALQKPDSPWRGLAPDATGPVSGRRPPALTSPARAWIATAWDSALGDGTLSHLPPEFVQGYALLFQTSKDIVDQQKSASVQLVELTPLSFDQTLTPQEKARYLAAAAQADRTLAQMDSMAQSILYQAVQGDFWPPDDKVKRLIDLTRKQMGACVQAPERSSFTHDPQGAPIPRWRRGD